MARSNQYRYKAKVVKVLKWNIFEVEIDLGFKVSIRLVLKLAGLETDPFVYNEQELFDFMRNFLEGEKVKIQTLREIKGLWLTTLWKEEVHVNSYLLKKNWVRQYN